MPMGWKPLRGVGAPCITGHLISDPVLCALLVPFTWWFFTGLTGMEIFYTGIAIVYVGIEMIDTGIEHDYIPV